MTERLHFHFHALEKEMATHSSVLAWRIPGTGEPDGVTKSRTRLKRLSSSKGSIKDRPFLVCKEQHNFLALFNVDYISFVCLFAGFFSL